MARRSKQEDQYPEKEALKKHTLLTPLVTTKYYAKQRLSDSLFRIKIISAAGPKGSKHQLHKWQWCQGSSSEQVDSHSLGTSWEHIISRGCCVTSNIQLEEGGNRLLLCSLITLFSTRLSSSILFLSPIFFLKLSGTAFENNLFFFKRSPIRLGGSVG